MAVPEAATVRLSIKAVVSDIIGTTTSFQFLSETIHDLLHRHFSAMLEQHWSELEVQTCVKSILRLESSEAGEVDRSLLESVTKVAQEQMACGKESPALKTLQGRFLTIFYERGELKGHVFDDVSPAFQRWRNSGIGLAIYSSGSTNAQHLLFKNSTSGPLDQFIDCYFDTTTGSKTDPASYTAICRELDLPPQSVVFIADMIGEVEAACAAGLHGVIAHRPGNPTLDTERATCAPVVSSFDMLQLLAEEDGLDT